MVYRYRSLRFVSIATATLLATVLGTALAGCGVTSTGPVTQLAASPSPTFGPTATSRPAATATPVGQQCSAMLGSANPVVATSGDMQFTAIHTIGTTDPPRQLPDNLPSKPYAVNGGTPGYLDTFPPVNVHLYSFMLCNGSKSKSHVIGAITAKLDAFVADSNTINTSHYCLHLYTRQGMVDHTGCGGGYGGGDLNLKASFAANGAAGAVAPAVDAGTGQAVGPISLAPGYGVYCLIDITPPAATGTARYRIGFAFDGAAPVYPAPASPTVMNAAVTRAWDGDACLSDAMQQQMPPATTPPTYYICPQA